MLMIRPRPRSSIAGSAALQLATAVRRFIAYSWSQVVDPAFEQLFPAKSARDVDQHVDAAEAHRDRGHRLAGRLPVGEIDGAEQQVRLRELGLERRGNRGRDIEQRDRAPARANARATAEPSWPNAPVTTRPCGSCIVSIRAR